MSLREIERASIRAFVQGAADAGYLSGRVLDYGCGKQPYRNIVEAGSGEYEGYDYVFFPGNVSGENVGDRPQLGDWRDAVLCTQVIQYVPDVLSFLKADLRSLIRPKGHLVLTYPTNWPEVEPEDLHRFTKAGMERLLTNAGFNIVVHERREKISYEHNLFALGYGVVARA